MKRLHFVSVFFFIVSFLNAQVDNSLVCNNAGVEAMNMHDFDSAIESFSQAIEKDSLNSLFYRNRAYCYFYTEQYMKAEGDFLQCLALGDEKPEFFYFLGLGRSKTGSYLRAVEYFDRAVKMDPRNHEYYYHRGIAFMKAEDFDDAVNDFHFSVKLNPQHASSYFHRGQSYHMLRNDRAACVDWEVAEILNPELKAVQYEKVCSDKSSAVWRDIEGLSELETFQKPVFDNVNMDYFNKYVAEEIKFPSSLLENQSSVYAAFRVSILADGSLGLIENLYSDPKLLHKAFIDIAHQSEDEWSGGSVNGIPADYRYVGPVGFFTPSSKDELNRLKNQLEVAILNRKDDLALTYCNEILDIEPYEIEFLRMRIGLNSRLGNSQKVAADQKLLNELTQLEYRYKPDEISRVKAEMLVLPEDSVTIFYNKDWHITMRAEAVYFRKGIWNKTENFFIGKVSDYSLKDSMLVSSVEYEPGLNKGGIYRAFYPNGNKRAEGKFANNRMEGRWSFFYENGSLRYVVDFVDDYFKFLILNDEQGNDVLSLSKASFDLSLSKFISLKGAFESGKRNKNWTLEASGDKLIQEKYKDGIFVHGYFFKNGERISLSSSELRSVIFMPTRIAVTERLMFDDNASSAKYPFISRDEAKY